MMARHFGPVLAAAIFLAGFGAATYAATPAHTPGPASGLAARRDAPKIVAPHAILMDAENGGVLFERDADKLIFPASLAKLMTAEYVFHEIKLGHIKLSDECSVSESAWRRGGAR